MFCTVRLSLFPDYNKGISFQELVIIKTNLNNLDYDLLLFIYSYHASIEIARSTFYIQLASICFLPEKSWLKMPMRVTLMTTTVLTKTERPETLYRFQLLCTDFALWILQPYTH